MLDHISLRVRDFPRALAFYRAALAPIGYDVITEFPGAAGLGAGGKADLWLIETEQPLNPTHVAFASDRPRIDAFHSAALAAGGTDHGGPGVRADYHPHYYAAFVLDLEGNNVEVVCQDDPDAPKAEPRRAAAKRAARKPAKRATRKPAGKPASKKAGKVAPPRPSKAPRSASRSGTRKRR